MARFVIELDAPDEAATVRLLKALCKALGRRFGIRVKALAPLHDANTSAGEGA